MDTGNLKRYAPKARRDFIAAVTRRAAKFGLTAKAISPNREEGQLVFIEGQAYPRSVGIQRQKLAERIRSQGFQQVIEAAAYTWFNRFAAIRFMELHGYLDHPFRVLSPSPTSPSPQGGEGRGEGRTSAGLPEILDQAQHVDLPGLDRQRVIELKMDGTRDEELYRDLLLAQCRALHRAMPFLFEPVDDETELLLPDNLLQTDSLIRELVTAIPEADWQEIEIIGWLYQFYISEKKDQVIGKVVKSEDIPAATQLFTPNWIVKYMVQNSLGAQWLATYPDSPLKGLMEYYIEPAEQTLEVQAQLDAITPKSLNPEDLTLMDPACGSGHILVEAYELFKVIYLERGYRLRDIPRLILEKNLFGFDIDGRAAQLASFALMMKARADDRRLFERGVKLNVMALVDSAGFDAERLAQGGNLADYGLQPGDLTDLKRLFEHATTFGSLIQVPEGLAKKLPALQRLSEAASQDLFVSDALKRLGSLMQQTALLAAQYDAVVANPPYMGKGGLNGGLKTFLTKEWPDSKTDLFAAFIERSLEMAEISATVGLVTMHQWMFTASYTELRNKLLARKKITSLAHLGPGAFDEISGEVVQTATFVMKNELPEDTWRPVFFRIIDGDSTAKRDTLRTGRNRYDLLAQNRFRSLPKGQIAYWLQEEDFAVLDRAQSLGDLAAPRVGLATGDNEQFVRCWFEVDSKKIARNCADRQSALTSGARWFPFQKGGGYQRWYGNDEYVVDWENDGQRIKQQKLRKLASGEITANNSKCWNEEHYFSSALTWTDVSSRAALSMRLCDCGTIPSSAGNVIVASEATLKWLAAILSSSVAETFIEAINPTLHANPGDVAQIPIIRPRGAVEHDLTSLSIKCHRTTKAIWDRAEIAPGFQIPVMHSTGDTSLAESAAKAKVEAAALRQGIVEAELAIESIIDELYSRRGSDADERERQVVERFSASDLSIQQSMEELVSYAIGCAMGRYRLDEPGLIYAHSGNAGFDPSRYKTFPADGDGIIPITDTDWFDDDATHRVVEFISVAWDKAHLEANLKFLADNLSPKKGESSGETIRRYLCDSFFKDHLQTYKKRPIYWCFSSGKQKAFQCLVYLHRYHEGTLARMRMEYVVPLQSKMAARIDRLGDDIQAASTSAQAKRLQKERDKLTKQLDELRRFDEQLRHYADQRIALDLDDGVKVNYGKFGDLLAEVNAVTGK